MSLWFDLKVNDGVIGRLVIQRITKTSVVLLDDDDVATYSVTLDGTSAGMVAHRYGDGAWTLVRAALAAAAEHGKPHPAP